MSNGQNPPGLKSKPTPPLYYGGNTQSQIAEYEYTREKLTLAGTYRCQTANHRDTRWMSAEGLPGRGGGPVKVCKLKLNIKKEISCGFDLPLEECDSKDVLEGKKAGKGYKGHENWKCGKEKGAKAKGYKESFCEIEFEYIYEQTKCHAKNIKQPPDPTVTCSMEISKEIPEVGDRYSKPWFLEPKPPKTANGKRGTGNMVIGSDFTCIPPDFQNYADFACASWNPLRLVADVVSFGSIGCGSTELVIGLKFVQKYGMGIPADTDISKLACRICDALKKLSSSKRSALEPMVRSFLTDFIKNGPPSTPRNDTVFGKQCDKCEKKLKGCISPKRPVFDCFAGRANWCTCPLFPAGRPLSSDLVDDLNKSGLFNAPGASHIADIFQDSWAPHKDFKVNKQKSDCCDDACGDVEKMVKGLMED